MENPHLPVLHKQLDVTAMSPSLELVLSLFPTPGSCRPYQATVILIKVHSEGQNSAKIKDFPIDNEYEDSHRGDHAGLAERFRRLFTIRPKQTPTPAALPLSGGPSTAALTITLIFCVVTAGKVIFRQSKLLPVIDPPGTVAQALPVQYWTSNAVIPKLVKVCVGEGSACVR